MKTSTEDFDHDEADSCYLANRIARRPILAFTDNYLPGYKAGGPIRSVAHMVSLIGSEFHFQIVTSDRDLGEKHAFPGVIRNRWVQVGGADVMYLRPGLFGILRTIALLHSAGPETTVYLNSFFSRRSSIIPILMYRLKMCRAGCVVLAPRGEFSTGALSIKPIRKELYLKFARWLQLYDHVVWQASSEFEATDIGMQFAKAAIVPKDPNASSELSASVSTHSRVVVAPDLLITPPLHRRYRRQKMPGTLRIVFISRVSRMKNLEAAILMLMDISGEIVFDIYGPIEDQGYWNNCKKLIAALPSRVRASYMGEVEHERVAQVLVENDIFLLPTLGENFGHVIFEALMAGCPVLISDRTPWRGLETAGVGWDIPLDEVHRFRSALQQCVDGDHEWYSQLSARAVAYAFDRSSNPENTDANRKLFERGI